MRFVPQVNYGKVSNGNRKKLQFAVSRGCGPEFVFVPCESSVAVYAVHTGELVSTLRGHYNNVDCCELHPDYQVSRVEPSRSLFVFPSPGPCLLSPSAVALLLCAFAYLFNRRACCCRCKGY